MILQALHRYYERKVIDPDPSRRLPAFGLEEKEIPFVLELTRDGRLATIIDTRVYAGRVKAATRYLVPKGAKKTSGVVANLLWDNAEYVLGIADPKKVEEASRSGRSEEYIARLRDMHLAFKARIAGLQPRAQQDVGIRAVLTFLNSDTSAAVAKHSVGQEIVANNPNLTFRLIDDIDLLFRRPEVAAACEASGDFAHESNNGPPAVCLITGAVGPATRVHDAIRSVWGAQTSGANIVSFNLDAFNSFGKAQGNNAPVSPSAAFAYSTALNSLLSRDSRQRIQAGDASTVFWAQEVADTDMETWFAEAFGNSDDPDARTEQIRKLYESIQSGRFDGASGENRFFVLGLAPNAARIAVRFWHASTSADIASQVRQWFDDLRITGGPADPEYPSLSRLLAAVAVQSKRENVPPRLGGDIVRSVLTGGVFPTTWLTAAVQRCRAEQRVSYFRAAAIKACLNRSIRTGSRRGLLSEKEMTAVLDPSNLSAAYRLGRLFAVLEKIQEEASPGINATIRERYYGAASTTPVTVFTTLLRLKNHHLAKLTNRGRVVNLEKLLGEIINGVGDFPSQLSLQDQGRFAIGYYHQRQALFSKTVPEQPNTINGD